MNPPLLQTGPGGDRPVLPHRRIANYEIFIPEVLFSSRNAIASYCPFFVPSSIKRCGTTSQGFLTTFSCLDSPRYLFSVFSFFWRFLRGPTPCFFAEHPRIACGTIFPPLLLLRLSPSPFFVRLFFFFRRIADANSRAPHCSPSSNSWPTAEC